MVLEVARTSMTFSARRIRGSAARVGDGSTISPSRPDSIVKQTFTGFLKAVVANDHATLESVYGTGYTSSTKAAMGEGSGTAGGYLVPLDFTLELMDTIAEESFIYPRAHVIPMGTRNMRAPYVDVETAPSAAGATPLFGGLTFTWGSSQAPVETEPAFRSLDLVAWDLLGYAVVSNQWLWDAGPLGEEYLIQLFGKAAAWYAEYAFLNGAGVAKKMPLGILNAPATLAVARAGANHIAASDVSAMAAALLPFSWRHAIWATNPSTLADLAKIGTLLLSEASIPGTSGGVLPVYKLYGKPLFVTEKLPPLGSAGDITLFDPWLYVIGSRQEVLIEASPHPGFPSNTTTFRVWLRLDGRPQVYHTITLQDTSTVVSPYVLLAK